MKLILMGAGEDRPGQTKALADAIMAAGGNWLESHFARLGSKYIGSVLVEIPDEKLPALKEAAGKMAAVDFTVTIVGSADEAVPAGRSVSLEVVGADRPGIIQEVSTALASRNFNIEELESRTEAGAMFGETLFRAKARVLVPEGESIQVVREALELISGEIMVDIEEG